VLLSTKRNMDRFAASVQVELAGFGPCRIWPVVCANTYPCHACILFGCSSTSIRVRVPTPNRPCTLACKKARVHADTFARARQQSGVQTNLRMIMPLMDTSLSTSEGLRLRMTHDSSRLKGRDTIDTSMKSERFSNASV